MKRFTSNWDKESSQIETFASNVAKSLVSTQMVAFILYKNPGETDFRKMLPEKIDSIDKDTITNLLARVKVISTQVNEET